MVRKIIRYPNPSLRDPCKWIEDPQSIQEHIQDLRDTLAATPEGVALASNQILEKGFRVFVVKPGSTKFPFDVFINPRWSLSPNSQAHRIREGCLSIPELRAEAARQTHVYLTWGPVELDPSVEKVEYSGLEAQIIQHECEHLDGGSLADHISHKQRIALRAEAIRNRKAGR